MPTSASARSIGGTRRLRSSKNESGWRGEGSSPLFSRPPRRRRWRVRPACRLRRKVSGMLDRDVGSGEEQGLVVAVRPPHHVGRASGLPPHFGHFATTVRLSGPMSVDLDLITHSRLHVSLPCSASIFEG